MSNREAEKLAVESEWVFSPKSLSEQYAEALERALSTAIRKLKERVVLHKELVESRMRNKGEDDHLRTPYVVAMLTTQLQQTSWWRDVLR